MRELFAHRRPSDLDLSALGSQRGGDVVCRLHSLVLSFKLCSTESEAYIEGVLMRVATMPASKIASLTLWAWQAARA